MDSAEVYMTLLRPSMVPVVGESWASMFWGQIDIASWNWNIINEDEKRSEERRVGKECRL